MILSELTPETNPYRLHRALETLADIVNVWHKANSIPHCPACQATVAEYQKQLAVLNLLNEMEGIE